MYTRDFLLSVKRKALRRGVWFRALDGLDRSFINLTCTVLYKIKSVTMIRGIMDIVLKLREAMKGGFQRLTETLGVQRAWKAAENALRWGNMDASFWRDDLGFHMFHAMIEFNSPMGWGM